MNLRKNQANLTAAEMKAFVNAVLVLKKTPSKLEPKTASRYDDYVQMHYDAMMHEEDEKQILGWAHLGPAFLPWHRYFIRQFELDLQAIDPSVTLPYWDWTVDNSPTSSIWSPDFLGGNGRPSDGRVMDGPFAFDGKNKWEANVLEPAGMTAPNVIAETPDLKRMFGTDAPTLPTDAQVADALTVVPYYVAPWRACVDLRQMKLIGRLSVAGQVQPSFCNYLEGQYGDANIHNRVHIWIAGSRAIGQSSDVGTMARSTSPNDPVFFLLHCNIDRLWAIWQQLHPSEPYLPITGGQQGHNLNDPMMPWGESDPSVTPSSVLNHWALGYMYETDKPPIEQMINQPHIELMLINKRLEFRDIPETETDVYGNEVKVTRYLDIPFKVNSFIPVTLKIVDLPVGFSILNDVRSIIVYPRVCDPSSTGRLWVSYTSTTAGSSISGKMTIRVVETGQIWVVTLSANTVAKQAKLLAYEARRPRRFMFRISPEDEASLEREQQ